MTRLCKALPLILVLLAAFTALPLAAQATDCSFTLNFTGDAVKAVPNLSQNTPCVNWRVTFSTAAGMTVTAVTFQTSPDNSTWTTVPNTACSSTVQPPCIIQGTNPLTGTTQGMSYFAAYGAYVQVVVSGTNATGSGTVRAYGAKGATASAVPQFSPGGTVSGLTAGAIPIATGPSALGNSVITDDGTTITVGGSRNLEVGNAAPAVGPTGQVSSNFLNVIRGWTSGTQNYLGYWNNPTDVYTGIKLWAGLTADTKFYFHWFNYTGNTLQWMMGRDQGNVFILFDAVANTHRMYLAPNDYSTFQSAGAGAVIINGDPGSGTGGLVVRSGGATPSALAAFQTGNLVVNPTTNTSFTINQNAATAGLLVTGGTNPYLHAVNATVDVFMQAYATAGRVGTFSAHPLQLWAGGAQTGTLPTDGGIQLVTHAPQTCNAAHRGTLNYVAGGTGVKDTYQVCLKSSADAYAWYDLVPLLL